MATFTVTRRPTLSTRQAFPCAKHSHRPTPARAPTRFTSAPSSTIRRSFSRRALTIASDVTIDGGELQITIDANSREQGAAYRGPGTDVTHGQPAHHRAVNSTSSGRRYPCRRAGTSLTVVDTEVVRNSVNGDNLEGAPGRRYLHRGFLGAARQHGKRQRHIKARRGKAAASPPRPTSRCFRAPVAANYAPGDAPGGIFSPGNVTLDASTVHQQYSPMRLTPSVMAAASIRRQRHLDQQHGRIQQSRLVQARE